MMLQTILPGTGSHRLPFYLAAEEWIARNMPADRYFFAWQVAPTVICGRNQDVDAEVDLTFCRDEGIEVYRRKSGGGAVFADFNNIMFSHVAPAETVLSAFGDYTSRMVSALRSLGMDAEATGRNDITIEGRKVAGNAYWQCAGRSIVHGTMLFDTDERMMAGALTPSRAKLLSNKVRSVQSRITTVRRHCPDISISQFLNHMLASVCDGTCVLPDNSLQEIKSIESSYYSEDFIHRGRRRNVQRIKDVGDISVSVDLNKDGSIAKVALRGDFFAMTDITEALDRLAGIPPSRKLISEALGRRPIVTGMDNNKLAALIAGKAGHTDATTYI